MLEFTMIAVALLWVIMDAGDPVRSCTGVGIGSGPISLKRESDRYDHAPGSGGGWS